MHTSVSRALTLVRRWHEATNAGDGAALVELASPDIELVGPRGTSRGHEVLREWVERAGLSYAPGRWFANGDGTVVVVEEEVTWRDAARAEVLDRAVVASRFVLRDASVTGYARYPDLAQALAAAGLSSGDELLSD
jgi:ketosteroid isomerase-like protein